MIKQKEFKNCRNKDCGKQFRPFKTTDKYCSQPCYRLCEETTGKTKKPRIIKKVYEPIRKVSKKQARLNAQYTSARRAFLLMPENKFCAVFPSRLATEVHHKMGRVGTADEHEIPLIIDVRFFLPVSRQGHVTIEENPEWAKKQGFSLSRLKKM